MEKYIKKFVAGSFIETWLISDKKNIVRKQAKDVLNSNRNHPIIIGQYQWLKYAKSIQMLVPKIFKIKKNNKIFYYDMEYIDPCKTLYEYSKKNKSKKIFIKLFKNLNEIYKKEEIIKKKNNKLLNQILEDKVIPSINSLTEYNFGKNLLKRKYININNSQNLNLINCLKIISNRKQNIRKLNQNFDSKFKTFIHGDLTFENILIKKENIYFIDPYGGNVDPNSKNNMLFKSNMFFDLGKLCQSGIANYEKWKNKKNIKLFFNNGKVKINKIDKKKKIFLNLLEEHFEHNLPNFKEIIILHMVIHLCRLIRYRIKHNYVSAFYAYFLATYWLNIIIFKKELLD